MAFNILIYFKGILVSKFSTIADGLANKVMRKTQIYFLMVIVISFFLLSSFYSDFSYAEELGRADTIPTLENGPRTDDIIVIDQDANSIIKVDYVTGRQTVISDNNISPLGIFEKLVGITIDLRGQIIVADERAGCGRGPAIIQVNPLTGMQKLISDNCRSPPGFLFKPINLEMHPKGDIIVLNRDKSGNYNVIKINPNTGMQKLISEFNVFSTDPFVEMKDIAISANGEIILVGKIAGEGAVVHVDPVSGVQKIISDNRISPPGFLVKPEGITIDSMGNLLINDADTGLIQGHAIIKVDAHSGLQTLISDNGISEPGLFLDLTGLDIDSNDNIIVIDEDANAIIKVDPITGSHTMISDNNISLGLFQDLKGVKIFPDVQITPSSEPNTTKLGVENKVPEWIRNIFVFYAEEKISEEELLNAIQFLLDKGILEP